MAYKLKDHTTHTSSGHVYGVSLSGATNLSSRLIVLKKFNPSGYFGCFRFSYFVLNNSPGTKLYYQIDFEEDDDYYYDDDSDDSVKWEMAQETDDMWFSHQLSFKYKAIKSISFGVKMTRDGQEGYFFIDDVLLSKSRCSNLDNECTFEVIHEKIHHFVCIFIF